MTAGGRTSTPVPQVVLTEAADEVRLGPTGTVEERAPVEPRTETCRTTTVAPRPDRPAPVVHGEVAAIPPDTLRPAPHPPLGGPGRHRRGPSTPEGVGVERRAFKVRDVKIETGVRRHLDPGRRKESELGDSSGARPGQHWGRVSVSDTDSSLLRPAPEPSFRTSTTLV